MVLSTYNTPGLGDHAHSEPCPPTGSLQTCSIQSESSSFPNAPLALPACFQQNYGDPDQHILQQNLIATGMHVYIAHAKPDQHMLQQSFIIAVCTYTFLIIADASASINARRNMFCCANVASCWAYTHRCWAWLHACMHICMSWWLQPKQFCKHW